uniref:Interleukin 22 receptor, alpha 2 n=1 Tax=Salarias fasciatus TaxID=181472 RepID=A0A672JMW0_SALFA
MSEPSDLSSSVCVCVCVCVEGTCSLNLLLCPEMLAPPAPVRFHSVDYKNVLHWSPPNNGSSLQYHVQWKIYGEPEWLDVDRCQGVQRLDCDLSGVTSDPREWYYARVRAVSPSTSSQSAWALSPRFSPRMDTIISPPGLRVNFTERGIMVRVNPPRMHVRRMRNLLRYKIYIIPSSGEEVRVKAFHYYKYTYCLQAQTVIPTQTKSSARSRLQCGTTV